VICYLVASVTGDVRVAFNPYPRLRERVLQLDERLDDNSSTNVIIFHTGYPFRADLLPIIEGSRRQVEFVNIDHIFYKFSPGFNPHIKDPHWTQRGKWNYHHMCYFWFKQVFQLKILQRYRYMMRLDDDSQIQGQFQFLIIKKIISSFFLISSSGKWPNVFDLMIKHQALYMANQREVDYEYVLPGVTRIRNLTVDYIMKKNLTVRNPDMFADVFNKTLEIPNYWNNIEVVDLTFMQRNDVMDFIKTIDESQGIFLYRWGDAPLRYITLALFTNTTQVLHRPKLGLGYCHPC
jgi:hypothetical protein